MTFVMREFLLVSLSTAQFVACWFTPSICFKNFKCSLSTGFCGYLQVVGIGLGQKCHQYC